MPPIFNLIKEGGGIKPAEMMRTFNAGIGMAIIVKKKDADAVIKALKKEKIKSFEIGKIAKAGTRTSSPIVEFI